MRYKRQNLLHVSNFTIDDIWALLLTGRQTSQTYETYIDGFFAMYNPFINFSQHSSGLIITEENAIVLYTCNEWKLHDKLYYDPSKFFNALITHAIPVLLRFSRQNYPINPSLTADKLLQRISAPTEKAKNIRLLRFLCLLPFSKKVTKANPFVHFYPFPGRISLLSNQNLFRHYNLHLSVPIIERIFTLPDDLPNIFYATWRLEDLIQDNFVTFTPAGTITYHGYVANINPEERQKIQKDEDGRYYIPLSYKVIRKNKETQKLELKKLKEIRLYFEIDETTQKPKMEETINNIFKWIRLHSWIDDANRIRSAIDKASEIIIDITNFIKEKFGELQVYDTLYIGRANVFAPFFVEERSSGSDIRFPSNDDPFIYMLFTGGFFYKNPTLSGLTEYLYELIIMKLYFIDFYLLVDYDLESDLVYNLYQQIPYENMDDYY